MRRTRRRWRSIGIATSDDVHALQLQVKTYWDQMDVAFDRAIAKGWIMPFQNEARSIQTWTDLGVRVNLYAQEEPAVIFTGTQYDRGRSLIAELDEWDDWFAAQMRAAKLPEDIVPKKVPVPHSELSIFGGMGGILVAVLAIMLLGKMK